jgi:DNA-binding NarL/FixJ family response regulator
MTIRVLVADDQALVRAGFRMILETQADLAVVGEAGDGVEAVTATRRLRPEVVLMDIRMPNLDGLEATRQIAAAGSGSRVLILTTFDLDEYVYQALAAGASGFLLRTPHPNSSSARSGWSRPGRGCWPPRSPAGSSSSSPACPGPAAPTPWRG